MIAFKQEWQAETQSLWDLTFSQYSKTQPLDPQLLFAGQYYDAESGLAYNRFRYYDPETACYLCSDPIGLLGGETPYSYVANPLDWVDWFGLAGCKKWKEYEEQIQELYGGKASFNDRKYRSFIDGKLQQGIADNVVEINKTLTAIEAKYVKNWATSIRNPNSKIGSKSFAIKEQTKMIEQAKKYSRGFEKVIYHTNSKELAKYYGNEFKKLGLENITFKITPLK